MIQVERTHLAEGPLYKISGTIEENVDFSALFGPLVGPITISCKGLTRLNSIGVKYWIQYFQKQASLGAKLKFVECSTAFIDQLSLVRQIACGGEVESLYVPFACGGCTGEFIALFQTSQLKALNFQIPSTVCPNCSARAVMDDSSEEYFAYFLP